ncbi:hypothetical protein D8Y22_06970 [Salinadaptatus halalkaliphilus]|uniref:Hsp20/alpha crystallin family protein n=1 Tax=Salinadaptatus halalkaliphilus TaxID=2419781 RepID=A0A4S3TMT3_9EURY|nr:Hsp20/alpha crystallin family protein [Salinadaptatus halalkaliphilus]THE65551.1 hypothetical protein D8Y22_06970 [Salinadaptatus halalkaliphilus]
MSRTSSPDTESVHARTSYDATADEFTVVVDAFPASIEDVSVAVGRRCIEIAISRADGVSDGYISPPSRAHVFTDDRQAWFNNGVLTVTVGAERSRRRAVRDPFHR